MSPNLLGSQGCVPNSTLGVYLYLGEFEDQGVWKGCP